MKKIKVGVALLLSIAVCAGMTGCRRTVVITSSEMVGANEYTSDSEYSSSDAEASSGSTQSPGSKVTVSGGANTATATNKNFLNSLKNFEITIYTEQQEKPTRGTTSGDRYFAIINKVAKKYGLTINAFPENVTLNALQTSILSGKALANVISLRDYNLMSWLNAGVAADLNTAMKETGIDFKSELYNQDIRKFANLNNKQYAFLSGINDVYMIVYNKRLIQEAGLEDPINLYNNGQWTYDKLQEYLKRLTKRSSDGSILIDGLQTTTPNIMIESLVTMNGGSVIKADAASGKLKSDLNSTKTKEALQYGYNWYNTDDTVSNSGSDWSACMKNFAQAKTAMVLATKYVFETIKEYNLSDAVGVVPFPKGPSNTSGDTLSYCQVFPTIIPKTEEANAGKILFVMNEVYKQLYNVREQDFSDNYRALIRDNASYNIFKEYSLGTKPLQLSYYQLAGITIGDFKALFNFSTAIATGTAVTTAINTYNTSIETALSEVWSKWRITGK